jgi:hypothetical protein
MKRLRFILIALAVPAALLLGLHELGGTPISKGYDTGFEWRADPNNKRLILAADPEGNMTCWLSLELPQNLGPFTAETSTGTQFYLYRLTGFKCNGFNFVHLISRAKSRRLIP